MTRRPFDPAFLDALESRVISWRGSAWREVFGGTDVLRANIRGARWNSPEEEALYCSLDAAGASAEIDYLISRQPISIRRDRVTHEFAVSLNRVVDLRDLNSLLPFEISRETVFQEDLTVPQRIGSAVAWLQCGGLLVPSARSSADNLVIFVNAGDADDSWEPISQNLRAHQE